MNGVDAALAARAAEETADAIVVVDTSGVIRYWNRGATRIFGHSAEEMVGALLDPIIPERLRSRHWDAFRAAMERGATRYGDQDLLAVPALTRDGRTISIEFSVALLRNDTGQVTHVAAVMRDVTERRAHERELRQRLEALQTGGGGEEVRG